MESGSNGKPTFKILYKRLLDLANDRVRNGEYSERGLAKVLSVSQSHLHNILKGKRSLRPDLADKILKTFDICLLTLIQGSGPVDGGVHSFPLPMQASELRRLRRLRKEPAVSFLSSSLERKAL